MTRQIKRSLICATLCLSCTFSQNLTPNPHSLVLKFDFTKAAIKTLKEIDKSNGSPSIVGYPEDSEAMLDDLDTAARTYGETQTVSLLKDVRLSMSVNNLTRNVLYLSILNKKLDQPHDPNNDSKLKVDSLKEAMGNEQIKIVREKEEACISSVDRMLRSGVYSKQLKCSTIMSL